jgi:hypothetical protein
MFMLKKTILLLFLFFLMFDPENADAFLFQLDIGDTGQTVKVGWEEFTGSHNINEPPKTYLIDGHSITVGLAVGSGLCGFRDYGGGDLGGDMVYPDSSTGPGGGRVNFTLSDLPVGQYSLTSYHNDTKPTHAQQDPIDVTVSGAVSASTSDLGVVQTKCSDDTCLGSSTVTFTATGTGDVLITYTPTTDAGLVSKATLCGFELELLGNTTIVQFEAESSSDVENIGTAYINVNLSHPEDVNTIYVDYTVTGGTADTPGSANAYPKVGPIVINEIMYHPDWPDMSPYNNEKYEFIELYNMSGADVNLYDQNDIPWKFTDGIEFEFPDEANIPVGDYALVVKDTDAFAWRYGSPPAGVQIFGPYDGKLSNSGEKLELSMPGDLDEMLVRHYIRIDRINYSDGSEAVWPIEADGSGKSLSRDTASNYGNDPNNWSASTVSPGSVNP